MTLFAPKVLRAAWLTALFWSAAFADLRAGVQVGNVVYRDQNANHRFDPGEGVGGVTVQLFAAGDDPLTATPVTGTTTAPDGVYALTAPEDGLFFVFIPPAQFGPGAPLHGMLSLPGVRGYAADDDEGEDGFDDPDAALNGIRTPDIELITGSAPGVATGETGHLSAADDAADGDADLTIDLGFYRPVAAGNLVFADMNGSGTADPGEGVPGVLISLFTAQQDVGSELPLAEMRTDSLGRFLFTDLIEGDYRLMIPSIEFAPGKPLAGATPLPGSSATTDDDAGHDTHYSQIAGVFTEAFNLTAGATPTAATGETGLFSASDDAEDDSTDLTRDLGFSFPPGKAAVGNLVFVDDDGNGSADEGEGRDDVLVRLFAEGSDPLVDTPLAERVTTDGGRFLFENLDPGRYFLHVPASEFRLDRPLYAALSLSGTAAGDDDEGEDGLDAANPLLGGVSTAVFDLAATGLPTSATGEAGLGASSDDFRDDAVDLTRDFGFSVAAHEPVGVGNTVFRDQNGNNRMDTGEGIEGVVVQLFQEGRDPQTDAPLGVRVTDVDGLYLFDGLLPGNYFLHIPASQFGPSMPLQLMMSLPATGLDDGVDDDLDENGLDVPDPAATGVSSSVISLAANDEPVDEGSETGHAADTDNGDDDNIDLTVDFGFSGGCPQITVSPVMELLPAGRVGDAYSLQLQVSGGVGPHVWSWFAETATGLPDGLTLDSTGLISGVPLNSANHTIRIRVTDAQGCFTQITRELTVSGPPSPLKAGNLVFVDANLNGRFDTGEGVDGVTVQLFVAGDDPAFATPILSQETAGGGRYLFTELPAGDYFLHIPAQEFTNQGQLQAMVSVPGAGAPGTTLDDDVDENGIDTALPAVLGVSTPVFSMALGAQPSAVLGETGFDSGSDDADDTNVDLTLDFGFQASCSGLLVTPSPLPAATFLVPYSQQLTAAGGTAPYLFTVAGSLPPGLSLSIGGLLSGTPTAAGSFGFQIDVTSADECVKRVAMTLTVEPGLGVGNWVYLDEDDDGLPDADEGLDGVVVRLFPENADPQTATPLAERTSAGGGFYLFAGLAPGRYFLHVPKEEFGPGRPLYGKMSLPGAGSDDGLDDPLDENGIDAVNPAATGVSTAVFELSPGLEPVDTLQEGLQAREFGRGFAMDDTADAHFDLTLDLGFTRACPVITLTPGTLPDVMAGDAIDQSFFASGGTMPYTWTPAALLPETLTLSPAGRLTGTMTLPGSYELRLRATDFFGCRAEITVMLNVTPQVPLSVGNLIFIDHNRNGHADEGEGVPGAVVRLYREGMNPLTSASIVEPVTTDADGRYLFTELGAGRYFVHVPAAAFLEGGPLYQHISMPGSGADNGQDDDIGENGVDTTIPSSFGISSTVFALAADTEAVNTGTETGLFADDDLGMDNDGDMTIDLGFVPLPPLGLQIGNLVYVDMDGDNRADTGEGLDGVTVQLFVQGDNPQFADPQQSQITSGGGFYRFGGLTPGNYFIHIPALNFQAGGALANHLSVTGYGFDAAVDDDGDENGVDAPNPAATGVSSFFVNLGYYLEPTDSTGETGLGTADDSSDDPNGNMTVDFGFRRVCPVLTITPDGGSFDGMQALPFAQSFTAGGGVEPYVFSVVGTLPQGLALSSAGLLSGTPVNAGSTSFSIRATDAHACAATVNVSFTAAPAPPGTTIGNLVFIDVNENAVADPGEGVPGVTVQLRSALGAPVSSMITDANGLYAFENVPPGSYFVEIPASMFATTAPLGGMKSLPGVMSSGDDDVSEDGLDAPDPRLTGVRTADFTLAIGTAPTSSSGESGIGSTSDDTRDPFTDLTIDLGFTNALPRTFALWQAENALGGQNGPDDNPDGDRSSNLMEFALGQNGGSGVEDPQFPGFYLERTANGTLDAVIWRRAGGMQGLSYMVEAWLNDEWTELGLPPVITPKPAGLEEVRIADIESDPLLSGLDGGELRLHVALDTNGDDEPDAEAVTPVWSWKRRVLAQRAQTFCMPLVRKDVFTGAVDGVVTGTSLDITTAAGAASLSPYFTDGRRYYVEVIGGDHEGHRWDIDEAQSTATMLRIDLAEPRNTLATLPVTLAGDLIAVRAHWSFNDLFPPARFSANNSQSAADRVVALDRATGVLREFWLFSNSGAPKWVMSGDARLVDQGERVVDPAEGVFLHARGTPVSLPQAGVARTNAFVVPLRAGNNLVGAGWAVAQSPLDRGMTVAAGFTANANAATADRIHVWRGDIENLEAYTSYTFMNFGGSQFWDQMGDADLVDSNNVPVFDAWRATFIISRAGNPAWTLQPPPVTP
ncbi:MAG: putative Ig domain-containing protein [Verrucomicrobiaceae bacterium]|nr:putative Ig domain-containing protein [Verrucomicrobiaceae bacterium]